MTDATAPVAAAIASAQEQLQTALAALAALPIVEADALAVTRHTLHNYLALTGMTLEVVLRDLGPAADPSILSWLHGLQHVTDLMAHTVRRLGATPVLEPEHLECERVDIVAGVRRVCHFFDRQAQRKQLTVHLETRGAIAAGQDDSRHAGGGRDRRHLCHPGRGARLGRGGASPVVPTGRAAQSPTHGGRSIARLRPGCGQGTPRPGRGLALVSECAGPGGLLRVSPAGVPGPGGATIMPVLLT
jgi:hypothetical protein